MKRENRPSGRQKRVGTGSGRVERRGTTPAVGSGGPAGGPGGFFAQKPRPSGQTDQPSSFPGFGSAPAPGRRKAGGLGKLVVMVLIALAVMYFMSRMGGGGLSPGGNGILPGTPSGTGSGTYDQGAYPVDRTVSESARARRTTLLGDGRDRTTIMVYLLGTDLESRSGMATRDLQEMLAADLSENVNIILETGGTASWKNDVMKHSTNQRYRISSSGLSLLEDNLGKRSMVDPATLTDFIRYSQRNFPAERYFLLFWDHGGGSVSGYGYDEHFKGDTMTLDEIGQALENAGCAFDLIGFDACLMATLETALVAEPHADYLIASEELEPGIGWHYTGWLDALSRDPSMATIDLGKVLIDDYIREVKRQTPGSQATLSLVDLAELQGTVPGSFREFARSTAGLLESENYRQVSDSRAATKEFAASSRINQIDLIDFARKLDTPESREFAGVLGSAVKYNRMSDNITSANGLSIYFPYGKLSDVSTMLETYDEIGMDQEYSDAIRSSANLNAGGQMASQGGGLLETLLGGGGSSQGIGTQAIGSLLNSFLTQGNFSSLTGGDPQAPQWLEPETVTQSAQYYSENMLDPADIVITEKDGKKVLALSEEQWGLIQNLELNVFIDDGEGFIDLGRDNVFEYNRDGDLLLEYDGTWLAINGRIVSYYLTSHDAYGDTWKTLGRVPAMLNGQRADIIVSFDQDTPYGEVLGARIVYDPQSETPNLPKGLVEILPGDRIDYLCDYYTYQGEYTDTWYLGDPDRATGDWYIENLHVTNLNYLMTYRITDIYGNHYWTPPVTG